MNSKPDTFSSADGSTRCVRCHLHPDMCTCSPDHPLWVALGARARRLDIPHETKMSLWRTGELQGHVEQLEGRRP